MLSQLEYVLRLPGSLWKRNSLTSKYSYKIILIYDLIYLQLYKDTSSFRSNLKKKAISLIHSAYNLPLSPKEMPEELANPTAKQTKERDQLVKKLIREKIAVLLDNDKANPGHFLKNGKNPITVGTCTICDILLPILFLGCVTEKDQQSSASCPSSGYQVYLLYRLGWDCTKVSRRLWFEGPRRCFSSSGDNCHQISLIYLIHNWFFVRTDSKLPRGIPARSSEIETLYSRRI